MSVLHHVFNHVLPMKAACDYFQSSSLFHKNCLLMVSTNVAAVATSPVMTVDYNGVCCPTEQGLALLSIEQQNQYYVYVVPQFFKLAFRHHLSLCHAGWRRFEPLFLHFWCCHSDQVIQP